ncbi:MAG TPA: TrmB family transcriptional regulator [Chloroflexia bacterium]|jgi:predicted ArsR family transcriptional regulator|nr:TrmB family transcriptional regulator [Chloroflexia bacterium]
MAVERSGNVLLQNSSPRMALLRLLQKRGQASIKEMEVALGVTATAVREQLSHLMAEGVVTATRVRGEVGRPFYVYALTDKAQELFPKDYGTLARLLLEETLAAFGPDGYAQILERVGRRLADEFAGEVHGREMEDKLYGLATLLVQKGFDNEVTRTADGFVLHAGTCPYFAVVKDHREICDMEQRMMSRLLDADVHLGSCMLEGHTACQFSVRPRLEERAEDAPVPEAETVHD